MPDHYTAEDLNAKSVIQLKAICDLENLLKTGNKGDLVARILENLAQPALLSIPRIDIQVSVGQLIFDPRNYRLTTESAVTVPWENSNDQTSQEKCHAYLWGKYNAKELYENMRHNGISFQDRLVVAKWPDGGEPGQEQIYIVLEGNRRLRAFKELQDNRATLNPTIAVQLDELKVVEMVYRTGEYETLMVDARKMMAVRHLCGTKEWKLYGQALACKDAFDEYGSARSAAESRGISSNELKKNLRTLNLYNHIQNQYQNKLRPEDFSGLKGLAQASAMKQWLNLGFDNDTCELDNTVREPKMDILLRKWKGHLPNGVDAKGDESTLTSDQKIREAGKILDSQRNEIITKWECGEIRHSDAHAQALADPTGGWPQNAHTFILMLDNVAVGVQQKWKQRDINLLESCRDKADSSSNDYTNTMAGKPLNELIQIGRSVGGVAIPRNGTDEERKILLLERLLNRAD